MAEIKKMLCLSTGHIPKDVRNGIEEIAQGNRQFGGTDWQSGILATDWCDYGWIVRVTEDELDPALPESLAACLAFAKTQDARFIQFDTDVEPIAQLPEYD